MSHLDSGNDRYVYYESYGSGSSALVLIHGWGMSCRTWDYVVPALVSTGYRVVLIDHRGCGRSSMDFDDMSIPAIAGDVVDLVDHLGLEKVVLNGWSLGGAVAVEAADRLGGRCNGLVLTTGATPVYVQKPDFPHGGTAEDMANTLAALAADRVGFLHGLAQAVCAKPVGEHVENWLWSIFLQSSPVAGSTLGELAELDQREQLKSLPVPVLSFVGSEDAIVAPPICRWVGDHHPESKVVEFDGVGHAPFIEVPEAYLEALQTFLQEKLITRG